MLHGEIGKKLPVKIKTAALQLYTDEGYHALFSYQLATKAAEFNKFKQCSAIPKRITQIHDLVSDSDSSKIEILWFIIGFVSETIIAKELAALSKKNLITSVYKMFSDHLADESAHAKFFSNLFICFWEHSTDSTKLYISEMLPAILKIFASIDEPWLTRVLLSAGITLNESLAIIENLTSQAAINTRIKSGASATFATLRRAGLFDDALCRQPFIREGLHEI